MAQLKILLPDQCLQPGTPEFKSTLGCTSGFSFQSFSENYLRTFAEERRDTDFDPDNLITHIDDPKVLHFKNVMLSRFSVLYDKQRRPIPEALNSYTDECNFVARHPPIPHSDQFWKKVYYRLHYKLTKRAKLNRTHSTKTPILFYDQYFFNFTHFILEAYPRLYWIRKQFPNNPILLPPSPTHGGYDYYQHIQPCLDSLGIREEDCLKLLPQNYIFDDLIMPSQIKMHPEHVPVAIKHLKQYFYDPNFTTEHDKVYISREKGNLRDIANRQEVEDILLKKYNFKKVIMEELKLSEKINLMARTHCLVTCESSSITNAVFMPEQAKVLGFRLFDCPNFNFYLFSLFKQYFTFQICNTPDGETSWYTAKLQVDIQQLEQNLNNLLNCETEHKSR